MWGTRPGVRRVTCIVKDAVKCGYNTTEDTEAKFPSQDYRMISLFESVPEKFTKPVREALKPTASLTGQDASWSVGFPSILSDVHLIYYKPIVMSYMVMNPCNSTICLDVEVFSWKRGFSPLDASMTLSKMYTDVIADADNAIATGILMQHDEITHAVNTAPQIHGQFSVAVPTITENAVNKGIDQIFHLPRLRQRFLKRLSSRKCVAIPPGGIFKFKVVYRVISGIPDLHNTPYPVNHSMDRLVVLRWATQMGTVASELESSHLSEKVHIVVGRRCAIRATVYQRVPPVVAQVVYNHDGAWPGGTNYMGTAVSEHLAVQQVTKSTQNIETTP